MTTAALTFSTREINRDWRIKVSGFNAEGRKLNTLVGCSGLLALIGAELMNKFLNRAYACDEDACVCKLRRGLKITFYNK